MDTNKSIDILIGINAYLVSLQVQILNDKISKLEAHERYVDILKALDGLNTARLTHDEMPLRVKQLLKQQLDDINKWLKDK